jgi:hypothetical protein
MALLKRQELEILDRAIADLGPQSYLGPWLVTVRGEVESRIASDLEPAMLPHEAYRLAQTTIADARLEAERIKAEATTEVNKRFEDARKRVDEFNGRARRDLERLAGQI